MFSEHLRGSEFNNIVDSLIAKSYYDELGKTNFVLEETIKKQIVALGGPEKALRKVEKGLSVESQLYALAEAWFFEEAG